MNEREIGEEKQNKEGGWETEYRLNNITTGIHSLCFWSWINNRGSGETEQSTWAKTQHCTSHRGEETRAFIRQIIHVKSLHLPPITIL